jgi:uncharacterized protein (TIRG00374 family)
VTRRTVLHLLSWVLALAILAALVLLLDPGRIFGALARTDPGWVLGGMAAVALTPLVRGVRWWILARPLGPISPATCIRLAYSGMFLNIIIPLRGGDVARALVLARETGVRRGECLGTVALDKLMDMVGLAVVVVPLAFLSGIPHWIRWPPVAAIGGALVLLGVGVVVRGRMRRAERDVDSLALPLRWLASFASGFDTARSPSAMAGAFGLTVVVYGCFLASVVTGMAASGVAVGAADGLLVLLAIQFSAGVPITPTSAGTMHGAVAGVLVTTGTEASLAMSTAIVVHAIQILPLVLAGVLTTRSTAMGRALRQGVDSTAPPRRGGLLRRFHGRSRSGIVPGTQTRRKT